MPGAVGELACDDDGAAASRGRRSGGAGGPSWLLPLPGALG